VAAYPAPGEQTEEITGGPPIVLNKPVVEGNTEVSGVGPAGLPILIVDVTFMREFVVETVIGADGTFTAEVPALPKDHRIGVTISNLEGTEWENVDLNAKGFYGEEAMLVPMVGFFYDTAMVQGK
jgi:hypothetical protein